MEPKRCVGLSPVIESAGGIEIENNPLSVILSLSTKIESGNSIPNVTKGTAIESVIPNTLNMNS